MTKFPIIPIFLFFCSFTALAFQEQKTANPNGRNDAWGYAGFGGGGAMFFPAVSPHDARRAMVACDMTGSFATNNAGESWRMFNLRGPVSYFVFDPLDSNTVYANSIALFKSTDRGNSWSLFYPSPLEVDGVVSIGDHANEVLVTKDSTARKVLAFTIDPGDSKKLYAAISVDRKTGFYISADGGIHWEKETDLADGVKNIYVNPLSPAGDRTILVCGQNNIVKRENGKWKTGKAPDGVSRLTEFAGGFDNKSKKFIVYATAGTSYFNPEKENSGIYFTANGGETWENRQSGLLAYTVKNAETPEWRSIATSAQHPGVVYVSYANMKVHTDTTCIGVAKSEDFGKTWRLVWKDKLNKNGNIPAGNFENEWINERFGPTWGENPFSLGIAPSDPDICYATDFGRTVMTMNGGKTWKQVYTRKKDTGWVSRGLEVTTSYVVVFDPFDKNHAFIANTDIGLMESKDGGESWASATVKNGVPRAWENSTYWLEFDPAIKGRIYAVMSGNHDLPRPKMWRRNGVKGYVGGVLVSEDGGKSWLPISKDIGESAMTHILIDPASSPENRTLYACGFGKGVYKSIDGGKSWQQKNKGIEGAEPFAWRIVKRQKDGVLFLVASRRSEGGSMGTNEDGALYRSSDGAETWVKVPLPEGTNGPTSIAVDPENDQKLLLSAWGRPSKGRFSPDNGGGIFVTDNDGKTWKHVLDSDQHIHDITYDVRIKKFYACGFNGSAYSSVDAGGSWQRIKGYNFKWGKRVDPDPRDPSRIFIVTFGGGIWYGPAEGDPYAVEDIITPLIYK
jgi:photosystem II stability/assembly factor-like uncharacterized protein